MSQYIRVSRITKSASIPRVQKYDFGLLKKKIRFLCYIRIRTEFTCSSPGVLGLSQKGRRFPSALFRVKICTGRYWTYRKMGRGQQKLWMFSTAAGVRGFQICDILCDASIVTDKFSGWLPVLRNIHVNIVVAKSHTE